MLRLFPITVQGSPVATPFLSLEYRIGLLRRRRRVSLLKQLLAVIGPVLVGMTLILLLAAGGVIASAR